MRGPDSKRLIVMVALNSLEDAGAPARPPRCAAGVGPPVAVGRKGGRPAPGTASNELRQTLTIRRNPRAGWHVHSAVYSEAQELSAMFSIIGTIIIGFIAGVIAKFLMPGNNEPSGFILTTILGIVGAFVATFIGQAVGWYGPNQGAGFIGASVGAVGVLAIYGFVAGRSRTTTL